MKKCRIVGFLVVCILLTGCSRQQTTLTSEPQKKRYEASFMDVFDTVTTIIGYDTTEEAFGKTAQQMHDALLEYHQLFDIYNTYPKMSNLKTVNDQAGIAPVEVDRRLMNLLLFCKEVDAATEGYVNAAMGSVLSLWHEARMEGVENPEKARLPEMGKLEDAALHMDFSKVVIDEKASTIYIADAAVRLDVGSIAKGYAVEQVCRSAPSGMLISAGGNVCATGPKPDENVPWVVGIQDPDAANGVNLHTLSISEGAVVTSGDYQRYYTVDGEKYHHIIDPKTQMPAKYWRCVTIICPNSGMADALSTALFLLPKEAGEALLEAYGSEAMWMDLEGHIFYSAGFKEYIRT